MFAEVVLAARDDRVGHLLPRPPADVACKGEVILCILVTAGSLLVAFLAPLCILEPLLPLLPVL